MTSRKFYNFLEIKVFFRIIFLTRTWNIGMMEYWSDDLKKMIFLCLIPAKRIFTITHLSIFSMICKPYWLEAELEAPEPNIPVFQYSNILIVCEASNLGDTC
ncbi:MAG: hypothetical protein DRH24_15315 [Deltaproteobacteria bacterium]|nr:MAG: hypothetical protein DRH24_15315 [Deltaproteobacteria bacterium]